MIRVLMAFGIAKNVVLPRVWTKANANKLKSAESLPVSHDSDVPQNDLPPARAV